MAVITSGQVNSIYVAGDAALTGLFGLRGVSANDTIDLAALSSPPFHAIKRCVLLGESVNAAVVPAFAGTVVTIPPGAVSDSAYLLVWGNLCYGTFGFS